MRTEKIREGEGDVSRSVLGVAPAIPALGLAVHEGGALLPAVPALGGPASTSRGATRARRALDPGQRHCDTSDGHEETGDPQQDGQEAVGHRDPCDEKSQADENQGHTTTDMAGRGAREPTLLTLERLGKFGVILMELRFQVSQDLLLSL